MVNNFICKNCTKNTVCRWADTITKKFDIASKTAYNMEITINSCAQFEEKEEIDEEDE